MRLIDADALLKALKANCDTLCNDKNTNWCEHCCPKNDFEDLIDSAPTVEPTFGLFKEMLCEECDKRPRGEWIYIGQRNGLKVVECTNCHKRQYGSLKYCGNCGADMRKEEEHDDS